MNSLLESLSRQWAYARSGNTQKPIGVAANSTFDNRDVARCVLVDEQRLANERKESEAEQKEKKQAKIEYSFRENAPATNELPIAVYWEMRKRLEKRGYKGVTSEEHNDLVNRVKLGEKQAGELLLIAHRGMIKNFIQKQSIGFRKVADIEEFEQECMINILHYAKSFDPAKGAFTTYMFKCLLHVKRFSNSGMSMIRIPHHLRNGSDAGLAAYSSTRTVSMETLHNANDEDHTIEDLLPDQSDTPDIDAEKSKLTVFAKAEIAKAMSALTDQERVIVQRLFMNESEETLEEIGKTFAVSRERVRQLKVRALSKMRLFMSERGVDGDLCGAVMQ